jgi:hypothetical protein
MFATEGTALVIEIIIGVATILAGFSAAVKWLVKHYLSELKTNGGSSMRDEIKQIKERQDEADQMRRDMNSKLDKMYIILLDHVSKNKD